jgi:hypothetical protein
VFIRNAGLLPTYFKALYPRRQNSLENHFKWLTCRCKDIPYTFSYKGFALIILNKVYMWFYLEWRS